MSKKGGINNLNQRRETREDSAQEPRERIKYAPYSGTDRFQTLYEHAPFAMVMIDREGRFQYLNSRFKQLFGYDMGDVPDGRTWFRRAYPDPGYRHAVIATWTEDLNHIGVGKEIPRVFAVTCKNGTTRIINFISVKLETGEFLVTCEDITERKSVEEALQEERRGI